MITWLLESTNPSIRYWTLTRVLDRPETDREVVAARRAIMESGPAVEILSHYTGDGRWEGERSYYTYKYTSTHWQLLLLTELAADGQDPRIAAACRRMIAEVYAEDRSTVYPCFHGVLVGYLHALGHAGDERVREFERQLAHSGVAGRWQCEINGDLPCAWGAARALWGLAHIPAQARSPDLLQAVASGVDFLAASDLHTGDYPSEGPRHQLWSRLSFPLFYQADVLTVLRALADLECLNGHDRFLPAVSWLRDRRRGDGRWNGASPYQSRMWTALEARRRPSEWITWQALYVLKSAGVGSTDLSHPDPQPEDPAGRSRGGA
jgi:hypothetical protein